MEIIDSGLIFRNPKPHIKSRQAYFPSVVDLGGGEMLCSMVIGEAFESSDSRVHIARSKDYGSAWEMEGRLLPESDHLPIYAETCRIARLSDGSLIANAAWLDTHREDEGYANPENLGFVEMSLVTTRSTDKGATWSEPEAVTPPLIGPSFEMCSPIIESTGGKLLLPTSTWRGWDGCCPNGMKAVAFVSDDGGKTWPSYVVTFNSSEDGAIYWEQKVVELSQGRLLAIAWVYDEKLGKNRTNAWSISEDGGRSFSEIRDTGLSGETAAVLPLSSDRLLVVYRRTDVPGLWAAAVSIRDNKWRIEEQVSLWGAPSIHTEDGRETMIERFNVLRFGAPSVIRLENNDIFVVFWCVEDCVSNIRWIRMKG